MAIGRPREFDREKALDAAMEVFWKHGYEGATIAELTEAMGIKAPSLYAAFGGKENLLRAALDHYLELREHMLCDILSAPTAREVASRLLTMTAEALTDPNRPRGCLLVQGGLTCGSGSENIPAELASRRAKTEDRFRERFDRAQSEGDLQPDAKPAVLARYLSAIGAGMSILATSGANREDLLEIARVSLKSFDSCCKAETQKA